MKIKVKISNHNLIPNIEREVVVLEDQTYSGGCYVENGELKEGQSNIKASFQIHYSQIVNGVRVYLSTSKTVPYSCSDTAKIVPSPNGLLFIEDSAFPNFDIYPTEKQFIEDVRLLGKFFVGGDQYSLPQIEGRDMNQLEIWNMIIGNLDTRSSGSVFKE